MKYFWRRNGFIFYLYYYFLETAAILNTRKNIPSPPYSPSPIRLFNFIYCHNLSD